MFIFGMLLGAIIGMFIIALMSVDTINEAESLARASRKSLKEAEDEIEELKEIRINAESRATEYARKIKKIENIVLQKGQGSIVDRFDKIKEVITSNQTKQ